MSGYSRIQNIREMDVGIRIIPTRLQRREAYQKSHNLTKQFVGLLPQRIAVTQQDFVKSSPIGLNYQLFDGETM